VYKAGISSIKKADHFKFALTHSIMEVFLVGTNCRTSSVKFQALVYNSIPELLNVSEDPAQPVIFRNKLI